MEIEKIVYPLSRYYYTGNFEFYYAYGNTPAQDFLQNCSNCRNPEILVLGCGDIRSCFYSLWKNFSGNISARSRFDSVHFVLNDLSAAVLARNVLFLYLCVQMPKEGDEALKMWLGGLWAIWYCHELHPEHEKMLKDSLRALCKYSQNWESQDNPLHAIVNFRTPSTLKSIQKFWMAWLDQGIAVSNMLQARKAELLRCNLTNLEKVASEFLILSTEVVPTKEPWLNSGAAKSEVVQYLKSGNVYAEKVLEASLIKSDATTVNLTFFDQQNGNYTLHYASFPYRCYYHTTEFSRAWQKPVSQQLLVKDKHFRALPLLANSVQQFSLWLRAAHEVLTAVDSVSGTPGVLFTCDNSSALSLCHELENWKFDFIYSSNLMDHVGSPNLVLSAMNLLKRDGLLFTATLSGGLLPTIEDYLLSQYGFNCKLFPSILGVRCINHEGEGYNSPVNVCPCPLLTRLDGKTRHEMTLIWEKVASNAIPSVYLSGQTLSDVSAETLLKCVRKSAYPLFEGTPHEETLSIETGIKVIQAFMRNTVADFTPHFWKPLCNLMQESIKPYLSSMQTQLFLHGVHMHLTVDDKNCPLCQKFQLSEFMGLFCVKERVSSDLFLPKIVVAVHEETSENPEHLSDAATSGGDVHLFDCFATNSNVDDTIDLYFYAPLSLTEKSYKLTILATTSCYNNRSLFVEINDAVPVNRRLDNFKIPFRQFYFFQVIQLSRTATTELDYLGTISSHVCTGDSSTLEITLTDTSGKLHIRQESSNSIFVSIGDHSSLLCYPFPVVYDKIHVILMRSKNKLILHCPRAVQNFLEEKVLYMKFPEKELATAPTLSHDTSTVLFVQQFTMEEKNLLLQFSTEKPALLHVKQTFVEIFNNVSAKFFQFTHPSRGILGLGVINKRLFDYETRTPMIDMAVCFLEMPFSRTVLKAWTKMKADFKILSIDISEVEADLLKRVFSYYSERTCGSCNMLKVLEKAGIQNFFYRVVYSPMIGNPAELLKKPTPGPPSRYWYGGTFVFIMLMETLLLKIFCRIVQMLVSSPQFCP